jgi:hydroxymethylpyrimidine/phosphomethylpyrimidine kinase
MCSDVLLEARTGKVTVLSGVHLSSKNTHGTGCTLASTIAALLAKVYQP